MRRKVSFGSVKAFSIDRKSLLEELRGLGSSLREQFDFVKGVFLFGSLAKGTQRGLSDVDILVVVDKITKEDFWEKYGKIFDVVTDRVRTSFDLIVISEDDFEKRKESFGTMMKM